MSKKNRKSAVTAIAAVAAIAPEVQLNMTTSVEVSTDTDAGILDAMLDGTNVDEILEAADAAETVVAGAEVPPVADIEAVVANIERAEAHAEIYKEQDAAAPAVAAADAPVTADVPPTKAEAKAAAKIAKAAAKAAKIAAAPPVPPKAPRVTYVTGKKSEVIAARLGDKMGDVVLLEVGDAALDVEALKARQAEVLASIDVLAKKVGEKATMLFGWLKNGGTLNEVMARTFRVLAEKGELTSGDKGNLQTDLLAKPYSLGTARSQANQMFMLLPALKVTIKEKGKMVPNPDSLIFIKAKAELGIA